MKPESVESTVKVGTHPNNDGSYTMFVANKNWGPVVTGKTLEEAKKKMKEAMHFSILVMSFMAIEGNPVDKEEIEINKNNLDDFDKIVDNAFTTTT